MAPAGLAPGRRALSLGARAVRAGRAHPRTSGLVTGVLAMAVGLLAVLVWWPRAHAPTSAAIPVAWQRPVVSADGLATAAGVRLVRVTVSGDGGLLDLRYTVVDPDKAAGVHDPANPPAIVDEHTGLVLHSLLMGHTHEGELKPAVTYYLIFENTNGWVHRGSSVTVLLGDAQVEHVVVA